MPSETGAAVGWVLLSILCCCAFLAPAAAEVELHRHRLATGGYDKHPLVQFLNAVRDAGPTTPCPPIDRTLPRQAPDPAARYLFAAILTNAETHMPHLLTQLIPVLLTFRRTNVCVSIYESGSKDATAHWLRLLRDALDSLRIPNHIVIGGDLRSPEEDRIAFLARLRTRALDPLFRTPARPHPDPKGPAPGPFRADHVVFFNDVTFCAQDVLRLLQHAPSTDIACGLDLQNWAGTASANRPNFTELGALVPPVMPAGPRGLAPYLLTLWQHHFEFPAEEGVEPPLQFYDAWVGHDLDGRGLRVEFPYATVPASRKRSARGLPFPVQCCWHGLAVLRAAPLHAGLRFRSHVEGECYESECTLLCDDYWRTGYGRVLVDPSVRVTYCPSLYKAAYSLQHPTTTWQQASAAPVDWSTVKPPAKTECCEGQSWDDCRLHFPWLEKNYTDIAIKGRFPYSDTCYALTTSQDRCKHAAVTVDMSIMTPWSAPESTADGAAPGLAGTRWLGLGLVSVALLLSVAW